MNNFQKLIRRFQKKSSKSGNRSGLRHRKHKGLTKKSKIGIAVGGTLGVLLLVGIIGGVIWFKSHFDYDYKPITKDPEQLEVVHPPEGAEEIVNIALFGIDSRDDDYRGLSDTIMVISIDPEIGSIKLVSIMRDSLVKVDGYGYQKINAAYSYGGPELAIKTLNQTYRLNIMNYATVDFVGMAEIVDTVGGVEVELTKYEVPQVNACIEELAQKRGLPRDFVSKSGVQVLNGVQAVAFSRVRKTPTVNGTGNDYGRTERQRLVMSQLFQKALNLPLTQYPGLIKAVLPYIETSMGYDDIFALAKILKAENVSLKQDRIPIDDAVISSSYFVPKIGACVYYDLEYATELLHAFFFEDTTFEEYVAANGVRKDRWYTGPTYKPSTNTQSSASSDLTSDKTTDESNATDSGTTTDSVGSGVSSPAVSTGGTTDSGTSTDTKTTNSSDVSDSSNGGTESESDASDSGTSGDSSDGQSSDSEIENE